LTVAVYEDFLYTHAVTKLSYEQANIPYYISVSCSSPTQGKVSDSRGL